jgi:hypothetical protein
MKKILFSLFIPLLVSSCTEPAGPTQQESTFAKPAANTFQPFDGLDKIWYQGKAEVSRYELQQNRYKDVHPGEHIMIFVTEDFLTDKQVKNERYTNPNSTPVLKNNQLRKFTTGLYDYSIMTSVFTPTQVKEFPFTEKVTTGAQDWCGHAYMQINKKDEGGYNMHLHSYFEQEADQVKDIPEAILEDELYNRIRMAPDALPTGSIQIYPSTIFARLAHKTYQPVQAEAGLTDYKGNDFRGEGLKVYKVEYPSFKRTVEIVFEEEAPHRIEGWIERYPSAFDGRLRSTIAKRTSTEWVDYWSKNSLEDTSLRTEMGIEGF